MKAINLMTNGKIVIESATGITVQVIQDEPTEPVEFCDGDCASCELPCGDVFPIPREAMEDAGLLGKELLVQSEDGRVVIMESGDE